MFMAKRGNGEGSILQLRDGRWQGRLRYTDPLTGTSHRKAVYGKTAKEARDKLRLFSKELEKGITQKNGSFTFGEWLDQWLDAHVKRQTRLTTWENYFLISKFHIKPEIGNILLDKLQPRDLQNMYNKKRDLGRIDGKGGLSPRYVGLMHLVCNMALKQAVKEGLIARNVSEATTPPKKVKREIQSMTEAQIRHFLTENKEDRLFAAFYLLIATGLRRGELLGLKWSDLDLEAGKMHIQRSLAKTNTRRAQFHETKTARAQRMVPLTADVVAELERHKERQEAEKGKLGEAYEDKDMVFCREDGVPIHPDAFYGKFGKLLKKADLPHFRVHDLRHTFATMMLKQEVHAKVVQEILGHSTISVTLDTYSHVLPGIKEESMEKMQAIIGNTEEET